MPTKTQKQDQKVAAFKEIGLSLLCAHKSIIKPKIAKAVKMITVSVSNPICGVVCMCLPSIKKCT